jgi:uncharacterized protein YcbK (DUF882 family)
MKYFKLSDFDCQETGENEMNEDFLIKLDDLRHECGFPFIVTSGYRSKDHSIEKRKVKAGTHTQGIAADIRLVVAMNFDTFLKERLRWVSGIGVAKTFIHLDTSVRPLLLSWSY